MQKLIKYTQNVENFTSAESTGEACMMKKDVVVLHERMEHESGTEQVTQQFCFSS